LLCVHAALLWSLLFHAQQGPTRPEARRLTTWLLPLPPAMPKKHRTALPVTAPPERAPRPEPITPERMAPAAADASTRAVTTESPDPPEASAATTDAAPSRTPLRLDLPTSGTSRAPLSTPANAALSDPRSNSPRLTPSERFAISLGTLACVVDERQPDGTVRRFEGHFKRAPTASASADPFGHGGGSGGSVSGDFSRSLGGGSAGAGGSSFASCVKN
jgi:hypothetical protein